MNKRQKIKHLQSRNTALESALGDIKHEGTTDSNRWFRTVPILGAVPVAGGMIDEENGVLHDVAVVTLGEAKGHGVQLDRAFLSRIVELGNDAKKGLKCRFGHPNASGTALGTFLGRAVNFRVRPDTPDVVRCDIHLDRATASNTPNGNLYEYVINMATKNPDMFGTSIVFKPGEDRDPAEITPEDIALQDLPVATVLDFLAVDIVDDPAANEGGLFSRFSADQFAGQITTFLDSNPHVWELLNDHPEIIAPFIERYRAYESNKTTPTGEDMKDDTTPELPEVPEVPKAEETPAAPEAPKAEEVPEVPAAAEAPKAEDKQEAVAASAGAEDRATELGRIESKFGAEIVATAIREDLSFDQASDMAFDELKKQNEALAKAAESGSDEFDAGADPVSGGEDNAPKQPSKYSGSLTPALAAQAEYFENCLSGNK